MKYKQTLLVSYHCNKTNRTLIFDRHSKWLSNTYLQGNLFGNFTNTLCNKTNTLCNMKNFHHCIYAVNIIVYYYCICVVVPGLGSRVPELLDVQLFLRSQVRKFTFHFGLLGFYVSKLYISYN